MGVEFPPSITSTGLTTIILPDKFITDAVIYRLLGGITLLFILLPKQCTNILTLNETS